MKHFLPALAALALVSPAHAQDESPPSPAAIVDSAPQEDWVTIAADDLLVMTLAPDAQGNSREVIIQLLPAPFSQGWVQNIRTLARAKWYDGISVNRVQDNYVTQWGDPGYDNPESGDLEQKPLPEGLNVMQEADYVATNAAVTQQFLKQKTGIDLSKVSDEEGMAALRQAKIADIRSYRDRAEAALGPDAYSAKALHMLGWPFAQAGGQLESAIWPVHCYGMVGVGRNYSPDTGSGAELYTVIGHAPRHLDRNIALVGRIISGMAHLSSLPRGSGDLGFYTQEEADKRTPILSVRVASDLPEAKQPAYEYLSTETETFASYAEARAKRRDPFFIVPAGGADICNVPVPVRAVKTASE